MYDHIGPAVGEAAPGFELRDEQNVVRTLKDLSGTHGTLLVFVRGTWCAPCLPTFYSLAKQTATYNKHGINVVLVAEDDPLTLRNFKQTAPVSITYPLLADADDVALKDYNLGTARAWFLIDAEGMIRMKHIDPDGHHMPRQQDIMNAIKATI